MARASRRHGLNLLVVAALTLSGCSLLADEGSDEQGDDAAEQGGPGPGTIIFDVETIPAGQAGSFTFTGVPSGTISGDGTLVVSDLDPGTYTSTEADPAPDFDVTAVRCDEDTDGLASSADPSTRTAVVNLDADETVRCTFTNAQRGSLVITSRTEPDGAAGQFLFTGVPSGTIPADGTLVVANLPPGTYTSTEADPAPSFDLTGVDCDDGASPTTSSGDPTTRSAVFQLDPGEMVTCTFTNTRRATAIVALATEPDGADGTFQFTGVPTGTVTSGGTLVVADLAPGTYTTTLADPEPDFELSAVECDDEAGATTSSGDPGTRSAIYNLDPGETTTCTFTVEDTTDDGLDGGQTDGADSGGGDDGDDSGPWDPDASDPFVDPDPDAEPFPEPEEAPSIRVPRAGPWEVQNYEGQVDCGVMSMPIPLSPIEFGSLDVLDGGRTVVGNPTDPGDSPVTMTAVPEILGRYTGTFSMSEQGVELAINFYWQVVTSEHIVGYLTSQFEQEGLSCSIYRPYELWYTG